MIRFGIIGCGKISGSHARAITKSNKTKLVAVCDVIEEKAKELAKSHGVKKVYTDYKEMLKDPEIDAVCICTPSGMHGEMCIEAAKTGKHIFCEKPIELTGEKIDAIIDALDTYPVKMQCVFQRRTMPAAIAAKKLTRRTPWENCAGQRISKVLP